MVETFVRTPCTLRNYLARLEPPSPQLGVLLERNRACAVQGAGRQEPHVPPHAPGTHLQAQPGLGGQRPRGLGRACLLLRFSEWATDAKRRTNLPPPNLPHRVGEEAPPPHAWGGLGWGGVRTVTNLGNINSLRVVVRHRRIPRFARVDVRIPRLARRAWSRSRRRSRPAGRPRASR